MWPFSNNDEVLAQMRATKQAVNVLTGRLAEDHNELLRWQRELERIITMKLAELKELAVEGFRENNESLELALQKIEELKANQTNPADAAEIENLAASFREQIKSNNEFQAKLSGNATPGETEPDADNPVTPV